MNELAAENALGLQTGDRIQLQFAQNLENLRVKVNLLGFLAGGSLIVTAPESKGKLLMMREGQSLVARIFVGERIVAFNTQVLRVCTRPYHYLHLSYPEQPKQVVVRTSRRVALSLPVEVKRVGAAAWAEALLLDLSVGGGLLASDVELGAVNDRLEVSAIVPLEGMSPQGCTLSGLVRNSYEDASEIDHRFRCGLEFQDVSAQAALVLRALIYEQVLANERV